MRIMLSAMLVSSVLRYALADPPLLDTQRGDRQIARYFQHQVAQLEAKCLEGAASLERWNEQRDTYRRQLLEMLGLEPFPERTDLQATVTATTEHDEFTVERLHFQSRPGLYVTCNLYRPKDIEGPVPGILYVCGHGRVKQDGVSFGNKVHYHHHGSWFARNGYVCLTLDTLQLGEIEGIHHGTHRENMWWWLNRGYTPAGVEAWNCVRALDYLQSRAEVDAERIGVTGRSGGGAYSWWIAAIDERIKCAVPVAGITDLQNHVVDGCVEGHCDCMFVCNTYRWDYPQVAALVAPRPLLISNTDSDGIFPLDGVYRTFEKVRSIYSLYDADENVGLHITAGPHQDSQELRVHAFRWFNHHLKGDDSLIDKPAEKFFEPAQLKVFDTLPVDQRNTTVHESFTSVAEAPLPKDKDDWITMRDRWRAALSEKVFAGWPQNAPPLDAAEALRAEREGMVLRQIDFLSEKHMPLSLYVLHRADLGDPDRLVLKVLDEQGWLDLLGTLRPAFEAELNLQRLPEAEGAALKKVKDELLGSDHVMAYLAPRGIGPTAWDQSEKKQTQHRRRFYLIGQSLDGMRVYDVRRAIQALRTQESFGDVPVWLEGRNRMGGIALYASLFEPDIARLDLHDLPASHRNGPFLLNVRRFLDLPQSVALAAENSQVIMHSAGSQDWEYVKNVASHLGWEERSIQVHAPSISTP